jgi:hypothetical protein
VRAANRMSFDQVMVTGSYLPVETSANRRRA